MVVEQSTVGIAAALPAAVSTHHQARGGCLGEQRSPQGCDDEFFGQDGGHTPADYVLGASVLKRAQVGPGARGER